MTVMAIPLTWVVALMSWKLVEEPALRLFKRWSKKDFSLGLRRKPVVGVSG
jgi:peptidoglycan/LPS O-acetylase OafA/YrhL